MVQWSQSRRKILPGYGISIVQKRGTARIHNHQMVSKKKKLKAQKRKMAESGEDINLIEIPLHKRKVEDHDKAVANGKENDMDQKDVHILLPTRESLAHQLLVAVRAKHFVILEGPIGCGKTFLYSHVSKELQLPLRTMQMGDQIDSKSLFGYYHCTEVAGQFIWKTSNFCQWLSEPCLILLEDLDTANADVISKIVQLASDRNVTIPTGKELVFHENVRICATISGKGKKSSVLNGVPLRFSLNELTDEELRRLVAKASPRIAHLTKTLISIFRAVQSAPPTSNSRVLTSSDLLRACARLNKLPDLSSNMAIFTELVDTWCLADPSDRALTLCQKVAAPLSITTDQVNFHLLLRQPTFSHDERFITVGRCRLPSSPSLSSSRKHRLGHTRDVLQLMERIAVCVQNCEPVLLVGETGVGKTSIVQALASAVNVSLKVVNLSPSSDSDELISGYKPTNIAHILEPFTNFYHEVFTSNFNVAKNQKFLNHLETCLSHGRYKDYLSVAIATAQKALKKESTKKDVRWASVIVRGRRIRDGLDRNAAPFTMSRGAVLEAAQEGYWLLIDEINLAPPESLDAIVHVISKETHPNFRLFACMNPATDAGKRRLPSSVRTRFVEFFVSEIHDAHQLQLVVSTYVPSMKSATVTNLVNFYLQTKQLHPSSYSLRTLCRALSFATDNVFGNEERNVHEGVCMAFLTNLDAEAKQMMRAKIAQTFRAATNVVPPPPSGKGNYVSIEGYWIERGANLPEDDPNYVVTKTVKANLAEIARIVSSGRFPVLLEGETSAGKTSIVCYLARLTGNAIVRINNHEHTDVQEYMGSYVGDAAGRLVFQEGALVKAVRDGSWVILDELNLAPTDIIETLNRLLDDNRELFVPEMNAVIHAHPRFRLFATQNPAGTYGGRKRLSRALMSRFVVLKFDHLPLDELFSMVCVRCGVHPSAATRMINVLSKLRLRRSISGLFSAKDGLMTLRDVFRWAKRLATDTTCEDWLQILANHGYFLLAGRCRNQKDVDAVVETLEYELKRKIEPSKLFASDSPYMPKGVELGSIVLTLGMRRMLVMTEQAWLRNEAVLLIGETGGGKTSLALAMGKGRLTTINCHERTETADLLGRLRPREDGGFAWSDGIVISAMKTGVPLLIDEISLAEDSVLERLNPLFEEDRTLLLSDAGVEAHPVSAKNGFQMIATMNPGGDYGKKELSKALRNRFTEVWSSCEYETDELAAIFDSRVAEKLGESFDESMRPPSHIVVNWIAAFFKKHSHVFRHYPSVRDVVACAEIYAACAGTGLGKSTAIYEAISSVFLDALGGLPVRLSVDIGMLRSDAKKLLHHLSSDYEAFSETALVLYEGANGLAVGPFTIEYGPLPPVKPKSFSLRAPTCVSNFYRIARGLLINKPILLEGSPGCGKSSTVMALAQLTGHPVTRLNLSEQTDLSDLFGSDVPMVTEDGSISFCWSDGPVLRAIKKGEWVLLDEMNLASQSVLEGLNACFDHRRVLYIAELNRSFEIPPGSNCRFFACQNPRIQGGNRRALPKSFVNRFTNIYIEDLTEEDILFILKEQPAAALLDDGRLRAMVNITMRLATQQNLLGGPFSFNLRDLLRWIHLFGKNGDMTSCFDTLYVRRVRKEEDRRKLCELYEELFGEPCITPPVVISAEKDDLVVGNIHLPRHSGIVTNHPSHRLLPSQYVLMYQLSVCAYMQWLCLLVGPRNCGKRSTLENLAHMCGIKLHTIILNAETDAQELIGSYEQVIDDSPILEAKNVISELLSPYAERSSIDKIVAADDMTELETVTELVLAEMKENVAITDQCREILACAARSAMRFEWRDSPFVKAYLEGHWLLIEDVNLCSAAVLDRLNSCLESEGSLVIPERQSSFEPLKPHPNFRVFLSMDPQNGEISRAMRNRSVEIFVGVEQQWYKHPLDVAAVTSSPAKQVPVRISEALCSLSAENQLHFAALLSEMSVPEACRTFALPCPDVDDSKESVIRIPFERDVGTESYDLWLIESWKLCGASDISCALLLALLSTSTAALKQNLFQRAFGDYAQPMVSSLQKVVGSLSCSRHAIDSRFHGGEIKDNVAKVIQRFVTAAVSQWFSRESRLIPLSQESAEHLSRTLSKYEMSNADVNFVNLHIIANAVDAIAEAISELSADEDEVFMVCLRLLLFVVAARKPLDARTGCALLYIAWEQVQRVMLKHRCVPISIIAQQMNKGWSLDAYQRFVDDYLPLYEKHRLVDPFTSEEECQRFVSIVNLTPSDGMDIDKIVPPRDDEEVVFTQKPSPLANTLHLSVLMGKLHAFFATGAFDLDEKVFDGQQALVALHWKSDSCRKAAQNLAVLNNEYLEGSKVSWLRFSGAFSTVLLSFWQGIDFDPTMRALSASHLSHFELNSLAKQLWHLASNSARLTELISKQLECLPSCVSPWSGEENCQGWTKALDSAIKVMENALPPPETLDPVVFNEQRAEYRSLAHSAVSKPLSVLAEWRKRVSGQPAECDSRSPHPVIAALWRARQELEENGSDSDLPQVFRQKSSQYSTLCSEMRSFLGVACSVTPMLRKVLSDAEKIGKDSDSSQLHLVLAQLKSFAMSAVSFKQKLLDKFASFVDISVTFLQALDIFVCALYEACGIMETVERRRELRTSTAFPINFQLTLSEEGLQSPELLSWASRDASPMPLRLKAAVVRHRVSIGVDPLSDLEWTRRQWQKWYEKNIARAAEKDFVYKNKTEEEKDELEIEEFFSEYQQDLEILLEDDLVSLIKASFAASTRKGDSMDTIYRIALVWIQHVLCGLRYFEQDLHAATIDSNLTLLKELISRIDLDNDAVVDVYRAASLRQCRRAAAILEKLAERTKIIRERWPEHVSLKLILEAINDFKNAGLSTSHMKMAALVEHIIEQSEEWEKMADRANSLRNELDDVRELLVDWKKMEVRSWAELLKRTENDAQASALLVAFPLFDALFKADNVESSTALCAMATEWITNATLLDYKTRIETVRCLANWATSLGKSSMGSKLGSIAAHFKQYLEIVEQKLKEAREPAERSLKDYVKIVKYNDLNLWNIKVSSQKAHTHLFKIVRKFKEYVSLPVAEYFDMLIQPNQSVPLKTFELSEATLEGRVRRAKQLASDIVTHAESLCDASSALELMEQAKSCDEMIRVQIDYQGEDTEKEKQQGYARNSRQRAVAMVIKESQSIGLNARKAATLNQEQLTESSLTEVQEGRGVEISVRNCAGGRNACLRKAVAPNDQLGVATRKHLIGVVDYGMAWILKCHKNLAHWEKSSEDLVGKLEALKGLQANVKAGWYVDHERLSESWEKIQTQTTELLRLTNAMQSRLTDVPAREEFDNEATAFEHPLSRLHSESPELVELRKAVGEANKICREMHESATKMCEDRKMEIYELESVTSSLENLRSNADTLKNVSILRDYFEYETTKIEEIRINLDSMLTVDRIETRTVTLSIDDALLFIQSLYKSLSDTQKSSFTEMKLMDRFEVLVNLMSTADLKKIDKWITSIITNAKIGILPDMVDDLVHVVEILTFLVDSWSRNTSQALQSFSLLYHAILSMSMQLFEKGYVNPIPKAEKQESGQGESTETGEGGGMGEGEAKGDAKDVTDEMEESGQIEGLQDEEQEPPSGDAGQNDKPIEMDEDFAEDLQDIDRNEKGDDANSGEESEEEAEPEDKMGEVDNAEDQQLDPKLWDEEEKDKENKEMDQDSAAAENKTDELAAKDDSAVVADEGKTEEGNDEGNDDETAENDVENVDEREVEQDAEDMDVAEDDQKMEESKEEVTDEVAPTDEEPVEGDMTDEEDADNNSIEDGNLDQEAQPDDANKNVDNTEDDSEEKMDEAEAVEQGSGGHQKDNDNKENESGGVNEEDENEKEENGKGKNRSNNRGEEGKGAEAEKEKSAEEKDDEESAEEDENVESKRELAQSDKIAEEEKQGEGEEDQTGKDMHDAPMAEREMVGAGSLEEARESKKTDTERKPTERKRRKIGADEAVDAPAEHDDTAAEEQQASIHLAPDQMFNLIEEMTKDLTLGTSDQNDLKPGVEERDKPTQDPNEAKQQWLQMSQTVSMLAAELAENLRLILEPQRASKMQGDYRTGKRLNMRRLIPYIASEYRKDRIWMRRTKKAQRDYQVVIAVDDSASMNENGVREVTCASACVIEDALRRCDAGGVSVCSFGSDVRVINAFGDNMMLGPELLQKLSFDQSSTDLVLLLKHAKQMLYNVRTSTSEQLLIIISDGRGALAQGADKIKTALSAIQGVTVLFVILDSGPKSITDLSVASFQGGDVTLTPYLAVFPFPFYTIIKKISQLPPVLTESIRQWFEMTVRTNSI